MKTNCSKLFVALFASAGMVFDLSATTLYVWQNSPNPAPPYTNWATAASAIQDAVDAALAGDEVVVTNGVYAVGGRLMRGAVTNRIVVDKRLIVCSASGPEFTVIEGQQSPDASFGYGAIRCGYLASQAALVGFTLRKGATLGSYDAIDGSGGGLWCESGDVVVSNCVFSGNAACQSGGGAFRGTLYNCEFRGNSAFQGGGAAEAALSGCLVTGNLAHHGGGADGTTMDLCVVTNNSANIGAGVSFCLLRNSAVARNHASSDGGGAYASTLKECNVTDNYATARGGGVFVSTLEECLVARNSSDESGGGVYGCTVSKCTLSGNRSNYGGGAGADPWVGAWVCTLRDCAVFDNEASVGGGAWLCILQNCTLTGNRALHSGGGSYGGALNNCTLVGNSVTSDSSETAGGGSSEGTLNDCIIYYNTGLRSPNYSSCTLNSCCTTPQPTNGVGNIGMPPLFVDDTSEDLRLQSNSPCINAGANDHVATATDLDGNPRVVNGTVDIGAYEYQGVGSRISYAWLQQYGLPTDQTVDIADPDGDKMNNWQEWRCQTDPTNAASALRLLLPTRDGTNLILSWQSVPGVRYFVEKGLSLDSSQAFTPIATNILGQAVNTTFTDANAAGSVPLFYRVGVGE